MATQGQLSPQSLVWSYCHGIFPMARSRHGPVDWYSPQRRGILPLDAFHVGRNLTRRVRRGDYRISFDEAFDRVIGACREPQPDRKETWISQQIVDAYTALHEAALAHSVEAWERGSDGGGSDEATEPSRVISERRKPGSCRSTGEESTTGASAGTSNVDDGVNSGDWRLVGGLYGVALGGVFFGESMFSRATDASKVCLVHLVERLCRRGFVLLDTQFVTAHLRQFGVVEVERAEYLRRLDEAVRLPVVF